MSLENSSLTDKVALVTGASSGIGEATALALAREGASVAVAARRVERLEALVQRITGEGGKALSIAADVADEKQAREMVEITKDEFGRLDILINNAGVMLLGLIDGANTGNWRRMINTNVLGLMYGTHAALPIMKGQGGGHIVNVSSVAGRGAFPGAGVYCATKWAVGAFSESLRREVLRYNIRVTLIEPGAVDTELRDHITDPKAKAASDERYFAMKAPLRSEDIAAGIVYAVSAPAHVGVNEILIRPTEQEL
jgi:NADP-dependent 3-hydroxy acid dehydrogenase YdfG